MTDNQGAKSVNTVPVAVTAPNIPPVAVATANPPEGAARLSVVFTADGPYDPDGAIGNYLWTFRDGSTYYGSTAYFTFTTPAPLARSWKSSTPAVASAGRWSR